MTAPLLSILVPVYNEERTIVEILARVRAVDLPTEIIVVDDGSTDGTASLVAHVEGITLLRHGQNRGKGEAIATALARAHGEICLTQDADLEYDPADIPALYARYLAGDVDAVYGSRILGPSQGRSSRFFYWGGRLVSLTASVLYGTRITDEPTGYKLIGTALLRSLGVRARRFDFCPELTGRLLRRGGRLVEIRSTITRAGPETARRSPRATGSSRSGSSFASASPVGAMRYGWTGRRSVLLRAASSGIPWPRSGQTATRTMPTSPSDTSPLSVCRPLAAATW